MAHRRRPLYEDQNARISILANGVMLKGRIRLCRLLCAHHHKPLADGAGHTFFVGFALNVFDLLMVQADTFFRDRAIRFLMVKARTLPV